MFPPHIRIDHRIPICLAFLAFCRLSDRPENAILVLRNATLLNSTKIQPFAIPNDTDNGLENIRTSAFVVKGGNNGTTEDCSEPVHVWTVRCSSSLHQGASAKSTPGVIHALGNTVPVGIEDCCGSVNVWTICCSSSLHQGASAKTLGNTVPVGTEDCCGSANVWTKDTPDAIHARSDNTEVKIEDYSESVAGQVTDAITTECIVKDGLTVSNGKACATRFAPNAAVSALMWTVKGAWKSNNEITTILSFIVMAFIAAVERDKPVRTVDLCVDMPAKIIQNALAVFSCTFLLSHLSHTLHVTWDGPRAVGLCVSFLNMGSTYVAKQCADTAFANATHDSPWARAVQPYRNALDVLSIHTLNFVFDLVWCMLPEE